MKPRNYKSPVVRRIMADMNNDPWYTKMKRWFRLKVWVYTCLTRKYWDKSFSGYIFKNENYEKAIDDAALDFADLAEEVMGNTDEDELS